MPLKAFEIKRRDDGFWVPAEHTVEHLARFQQDDVSTLAQIRYYLFAAVNAAVPGLYTLDWPLVALRNSAFARIDARSDALILAGFKFQDITFSLTTEAQIRYATMMMMADYLGYPLDINSLDDQSKVTLVSADHTRMFCGSALNHVRSVVDSGTVQKDLIRTLTDPDELAQFVDPRPEPGAIPSAPTPPAEEPP